MNVIANALEVFKPLVAQDYTNAVVSQVNALAAKYDLTDRKVTVDLANSWGEDGNRFRSLRNFVNTKTGGIYQEWLEKKAKAYAEDSVNAMVFKLVAKLGNLENVTVSGLDHTALTVTIRGTLHGAAVVLTQQRIINVSPKGKLFHQWPALIYVNGKKVSAAAYAKLI